MIEINYLDNGQAAFTIDQDSAPEVGQYVDGWIVREVTKKDDTWYEAHIGMPTREELLNH